MLHLGENILGLRNHKVLNARQSDIMQRRNLIHIHESAVEGNIIIPLPKCPVSCSRLPLSDWMHRQHHIRLLHQSIVQSLQRYF